MNEGCKYCSGKKTEYQYTTHTKLFIGTFGENRTLLVETNACPPYSQCCMKDIPANSAFIINFCPNCGRDLRRRVNKNDGKRSN